MILKSVKTKIGKLHYLKIDRLLKHTNKKFRKEAVQLIITEIDMKELYETLHDMYGEKEHLLAVPVPATKKVTKKVKQPKPKKVPLFGLEV